MVDKAQIFSSIKGDYYRTRMTHTLIVCQISRSISLALKLNTSLAEAIAAGHDLGHTPFGHQGERTLHAILTGEAGFEVDSLAIKEGNEEPIYPYGGFKHNCQSVRVATILENQYLEINGMDLSYQTLNGMYKHTSSKRGMDIKEFSDGFLSEVEDFAITLEGQVVAVADEIAQRSHDIDDAFASQLITIEDFKKYLELKKFSKLKEQIDQIFQKISNLKSKNKLFVDENELICSQISTLVVNYFINDVVQTSNEKISTYSFEQFESEDYSVRKKLVWFSDEGESLCKYLEKIITKKVISSHEVAMFDQNGSNIILTLFKTYYKNPMLLHNGTLNRIWNEYRQNDIYVVDFKEGKPSIVQEEWKKITTTPIPAEEEKRSPEQKEILNQRIILVRNICDFISGMTDSYAINEYHKIVH